MAIALAQAGVKSVSSSATVSTTLASSPTDGNIVVAVVGANVAGSVTSMTAPATGWTTIVQQDSNGNNNVSIFARVVAASESATYTAAATSAGAMFLSVYEVSGAQSTVALAVTQNNFNTSFAGTVQTLSVGPITPTASTNRLSINGVWFQGGTTNTQSIDGGFSIIGTGNLRGTSAHLAIASTSGAYNPAYSWSTARITVAVSCMIVASDKADYLPLLGVG